MGRGFSLLSNDTISAISACGSDDGFGDSVVTASFGVATTAVCGYGLTSLLAHADNALYAAKHAGRNRVSVHRAGAGAKQVEAISGIDVSEGTDT